MKHVLRKDHGRPQRPWWMRGGIISLVALMITLLGLPFQVRTGLYAEKQPGGVLTIQDMETHPGNVLFVDSSHAAASNAVGSGKSPDKPFSTLAYVMTNAASLTPALAAGDVIYVEPGHTETIAAAAGIACATAGVKVIGLGWGAARPTFTFSATDSTWTVTAASVVIKNIRVTSSINELVNMFTVSAADVTLDAVDYIDPGAAKETIQFLLTTTGATRITVKNCFHYATTAAASAQLWIALVAVTGARIIDNTFILKLADAATSSVINMDTSVRFAEIGRNTIHLTGYSAATLSAILGAAAATGICHDNRIAGDVAAVTTLNDFPGGYSLENYCVRAVDKSGILDPVVA